MSKGHKSTGKRGRGLTEDEAALWARVADTAAPLSRGRTGQRVVSPQEVGPPSDKQADARRGAKPRRPDSVPRPKKTPEAKAPSLAPFERRETRRITSGRMDIGARLDLHGMRQREAYPALKAFLQRAHMQGHRYVLVITGKGGPDIGDEPESFFEERNRGVLKRLVPEWLAEPGFRIWVVSYQTANRRHGGEGALYVRLRRPDTKRG